MKMNLFQFNAEALPTLAEMEAYEFEAASPEEKASMVETRQSVSYWKDAMRRFKANKVSMGALFLFLIIFCFSFFGPVFVPYGYAEQFRSSQKLGPREFSAKEEMCIDALQHADAIFATAMLPGSMNTLNKNTTYSFSYGGQHYQFYNEKNLENVILLYNTGAERPLTLITESDAMAGRWEKAVPLEMTEEKQGKHTEIELSRKVYPHYFGTDSQGRDLMARTMYGGRVSISIGIIAALIVLVIGSIYGSVSGLAGGKVDFFMMRIVDIIYSVPDVLIVLLLQVVLKDPLQAWLDGAGTQFARTMSNLGVGIISIFITFACLYWVGMSRIVRGQVLQLKEQEFVTAARALGVPGRRIVKRHLLPNCVGQLVIATCLQIPSAIFLESFLSFLGLGVSIPMTSLGSLCSDALSTITLYPYRLLFPGVILTLLVLSLNLVGDGIRDALDPRLKK